MTAASSDRPRRLPTRLYACCALAILVAAGFLALGVWQLERRVWKLGLIDQIEQRIHAAPVDLPGPDAWPSVTAARDGYRHVRAAGVLVPDHDTLVQAVTELGGGYWLMTPLRTDAGFTVLVNRGFVPPDYEPNQDSGSKSRTRLEITGLLRMTEPHGGFLHANDPASNRWYSRDVEAISRAAGLDHVAPYFIDEDRSGGTGVPVAGLTVVSLPNNHLVYAMTWFALAAMTIFAAFHLVRSEVVAARGSDVPLSQPEPANTDA
ncbi:SURF1 family protein [Bradyrhizobium sp.]|uniref:SURF1 family protein n=1 Tax=Bradyrhizobium sp. TaxID=376 RepID=UPI003C519E5F